MSTAAPQQQQQQQQQQKATRDLLSRAHSPDTVDRIYSDKIQHRTLHLRPSSPPPTLVNARAARRRTRQQAKEKKKQKPQPLSARQRRQLGLQDIPRDGPKYEVYEPLNKLWTSYIHEILGSDISNGGPNAAAKLSSAEFHGARVEVVRSGCPSRVGITGIVVRDRRFVMEVVTKKKGVKVVPKEGTTFRVSVDAPASDDVNTEATTKAADGKDALQTAHFVFDILGDQLMLRSADRANRRFKAHFLTNL
jgi:ribonuclease P protein subunit POP4